VEQTSGKEGTTSGVGTLDFASGRETFDIGEMVKALLDCNDC
jgi:hypothetical protein